MAIDKSSRHSKIIGDYGERVLCNWLSRSHFEVALVDHTGLDVIAAKDNRRLGITVKSRTRTRNTDEETVKSRTRTRNTDEVAVTVLKIDDRKKLLDACAAFSCEPWIGIYVETEDGADVYLTSLYNYECKYRRPENKHGYWNMTDPAKQGYDKDPDVMHIAVRFEFHHWFESAPL